MIPFSADEILQMAEQIERSGSAFYRKAAQGATDAGGKKLLMELSEWESQHESTFHQMRGGLSAAEKAVTVADPDDEETLYLQAFTRGKVFDPNADLTALLKGGDSLEEILRTAIGLEKDSIVFYLGLRRSVPKNRGRDKIEAIIEEEMQHIALLSKQLH